MLDWAAHHAAPVLNGYAQHLLAHLAPDLVEQAEADALARADARDTHRANTLTANPDHRGRIRLRGELDPQSWALVSAALEPFAKPTSVVQPDGLTEQDHRTVGQRNADALVEICRRTLASDETPTSFGFPAHIAVTIGYDQLKTAVGVGTLDTGTPIAAEDIRRYACDATILPVAAELHRRPARRRPRHPGLHQRTQTRRRAPRPRLRLPRLRPAAQLVQRAPHHPLGRRRTHQPRQRRPALRHPPHTHPPPRMDRPPRTRPTTPSSPHPTGSTPPDNPAATPHTSAAEHTNGGRHMSGEHHLMRQRHGNR